MIIIIWLSLTNMKQRSIIIGYWVEVQTQTLHLFIYYDEFLVIKLLDKNTIEY
jgi:hypothetical protein